MAQIVTLPRPANARPPAKPRPALRILPEIQDRTFLPAALEIIETPASPVRIGLMLAICGLATAGITWACIGTVDIYATARGKIEPVGHVKVVQPLQAGIVAAIPVMEGQAVKAGQVLLELDAREARADLDGATLARAAAEAEAIRREAEIHAVRTGPRLDGPVAVPWPAAIPSATALREQAVLEQNLGQLASTLANLDDQMREKQAATAQLDRSIVAEAALLKPMEERVGLRQTLYAEGNNSKLNLLDAEQAMLETRAQIAGDVGRRESALAAIETIRSERRHTLEAFLADDLQKLADARKQQEGKADEAAKSQARLEAMTLTAPIDGVVQALSVTNPGQVVTTGQEVMRVVPSGALLEVIAYISNDDIGFVRPGQAAVLKVDSFPFTRFGTINGTVTSVAYDALPADQANRAVADAAKAQHDERDSPSATPLTDLVFEARVRLEQLSITTADNKPIALGVGMTVTAEILTGRRTVTSYLLGELQQMAGEAGHER